MFDPSDVEIISSMTFESDVPASGRESDHVFNDTDHSHSLGGLFAECVVYLDKNLENASVNASRFFRLKTYG